MTAEVAIDLQPSFDVDRLLTEVLNVGELEPPELEAPKLAPLDVDLSQAVIGLLVTCGAYYPDQEPMRETNDLSYRLLSRDRDLSSLLIGHKTPVRAFAQVDPNVAYPRDRMVELEAGGVFGKYATNAISMVGSISDYEGLATTTAPRIVEEFGQMEVDLVVVVPFCPQCHIAAAVLARSVESLGLPTISATTLVKPTLQLKPPRATFLDFPLGCPMGRPERRDQQREILRAVLTHAFEAPPDSRPRRLPFQWDESGTREWEGLVDDLYRMDHAIRGTVVRHVKDHDEAKAASHRSLDEIRCWC